jgi:hypothetical protein
MKEGKWEAERSPELVFIFNEHRGAAPLRLGLSLAPALEQRGTGRWDVKKDTNKLDTPFPFHYCLLLVQ